MIPIQITPAHLASGFLWGALIGFLVGVAWAVYLCGKRRYIYRILTGVGRGLFAVAVWIDRELDG